MGKTTTDKHARHSTYLFILLSGIILTLIGATNWLFDPLGRFGSPLGYPPIIFVDEERIINAVNLRTTPPEIIIAGSSHVTVLDSSYITERTGLPAFTASIAGARFEAIYASVKLITDHFQHWPKLLLIGIDASEFYGPLYDTVTAEQGFGKYMPYKIDAVQTIILSGRSFKSLFEWSSLKGSFDSYKHGKNRVEAERKFASKRKGDPLLKRTEYLTKYQPHKLDPRRIQWLKNLLNDATANGTQVVLFMTPLHDQLIKLISEQTNYVDLQQLTWRECQKIIQENPPVIALDFSTTDKFNGDVNEYSDGAHMTFRNGQKLIDTLFNAIKEETNW